jgi:hypothetical protein
MEVTIEAHVSKVWIEVLLPVVYRYWMRSVVKKIQVLSLAWYKPRGNHVKESLAEERIMLISRFCIRDSIDQIDTEGIFPEGKMVTEGIFPLQFIPAMWGISNEMPLEKWKTQCLF